MNEIVNHTGEFTKYLGIHADEYGANLDSVFISGGSAGGQLTLAMALGIHNGTYSDIFGGGLTIKGIVPFYPANQENCESFFLPGESRCEFLDPGLLVEIGAPPCLIFQGTQDNLIERANSFKSTYDEKGNDCAIIYMPFAGHANDLYYSGYYNQVFLYYMERFLYIYR
ncbi:MAG: alpha/beta hydrolase fold domain-containing protein [archaeon]|nr:alpha/beta hydrolase fold domain-containing protein [archaeon]